MLAHGFGNKADTEASFELIEEMLDVIPQDKVTFDVLTAGVGDVRSVLRWLPLFLPIRLDFRDLHFCVRPR